jgi:hypothetical protein
MIGPFHETSSGNKYIVAATDRFSKWTETTAVPDNRAKSVATFLSLAIEYSTNILASLSLTKETTGMCLYPVFY